MLSQLRRAADRGKQYLVKKALPISSLRRNFRMEKNTPKVQALYELCSRSCTPEGTPPLSSHTAQKICSLLDTFNPADVGLKEESLGDDRGYGFFGLNTLNRMARWSQPITFLDIYESDQFTMCIFCFPTSSVIPLHDHPDMTVFSKVLYGSLHVKAYDWVEPPCFRDNKTLGYPPVRLAKLAADRVLTAPCETAVLYPTSGGNLHCFTAITPCAVLDILTPPYKESVGRTCTYYMDYPYTAFSSNNEAINLDGNEDEYAWLSVMTPEDLYMRQVAYKGPAIREL